MARKNPNAPKKGQKIKVEPIREIEDINRIKCMLRDKPRDLALFTIGINTSLRTSDLLKLKVHHVMAAEPGGRIEIQEETTGKSKTVILNRSCVDIVRDLLAREQYRPDDYLFKSRKGSVLLVPTVHNMVKGWCAAIKLKGNYGSHTLRKTWGYHQRVTFRVDIPTLMACLNHGSRKQTLEYLCIQPEQRKDVYQNEL